MEHMRISVYMLITNVLMVFLRYDLYDDYIISVVVCQ